MAIKTKPKRNSPTGVEPGNFPFFVLPMQVVDQNLNSTVLQLKFYFLVQSYSGKDRNGCWASNQRLATQLGVHVRTIPKLVETGIQAGLLCRRGFKKVGNMKLRVIDVTWEVAGQFNFTHAHPGIPTHAQPGTQVSNSKIEEKQTKRKERKMGFYQEYETLPKTGSKLARKLTKRLFAALEDKNLIGASYSLAVWSRQLEALLANDKIGRERVTKVLKWYCENIKAPYVPVALSAKGFRDKFFAIEAAMERDHESNPKVGVSEEAQQLAKDLQDTFRWPKGSAAKLPVVVQISLTNLYSFQKALIRVKLEKKQKETIRKLAQSILWEIPNSLDFVRQWLVSAYKRLVHWEAWDGNLHRNILRIDSKEFQEWGKGIASKEGWSISNWDALVEAAR